MDFSSPQRRQMGESIVPMINVVFLLLIFFLMTAQITPPDPFDVSPPVAATQAEPLSEAVAYVDKTARLHFQGADGEVAFAAIQTASDAQTVLRLRADAALPAKDMAILLRRFASAGLSNVELIVTAP